MAAQLLGTGGIASLLLVASATGVRGRGGCRPGACPPRRLRLGRLREQRRASGGGRSRAERTADEYRSRHLQHRRDRRRRLFLFCRHRGLAALSRCADPSARLTKADNLGLGLVVLGLLPRADSLLGALKLIAIWVARSIGRRDGGAAHWARRAAQGAGRMSVLQALDIGLAALVLAVAVWTIAAREAFAAVGGLCRLWAAAVASSGFACSRSMWR